MNRRATPLFILPLLLQGCMGGCGKGEKKSAPEKSDSKAVNIPAPSPAPPPPPRAKFSPRTPAPTPKVARTPAPPLPAAKLNERAAPVRRGGTLRLARRSTPSKRAVLARARGLRPLSRSSSGIPKGERAPELTDLKAKDARARGYKPQPVAPPGEEAGGLCIEGVGCVPASLKDPTLGLPDANTIAGLKLPNGRTVESQRGKIIVLHFSKYANVDAPGLLRELIGVKGMHKDVLFFVMFPSDRGDPKDPRKPHPRLLKSLQKKKSAGAQAWNKDPSLFEDLQKVEISSHFKKESAQAAELQQALAISAYPATVIINAKGLVISNDQSNVWKHLNNPMIELRTPTAGVGIFAPAFSKGAQILAEINRAKIQRKEER